MGARFFIVGILTGIVISNPSNQKIFKSIAEKSKKYFDGVQFEEPHYEEPVEAEFRETD